MSHRILTSSAALAEALHEEMARDETIFIVGEDLVAMAVFSDSLRVSPQAFPAESLIHRSAKRLLSVWVLDRP